MKKRKILALLVVLAMLLATLAGCGGGSSSTPPPAEENKNISVILMALNSDYWHMVEAGALIAGKEFGYNVTCVGPNSESDVTGEINMVEDAIANKVAAIVFSPNDPSAQIDVAKKVKAAGIPLIIIDANLATDEKIADAFIGTGNYNAGVVAGEYLASKMQKGDKAAIIRGLLGQPSHDQRANGAKDALIAAGMEVVTEQPADSDRGKAVSVAENILQATPDVKVFYCTNDEMALGAFQAVEGARKQDTILVMGFDGSPGALDAIQQGKLTASLAQMPIDQGYLGVKAAIDVLMGVAVTDIDNKVVVVDKDNVDAFKANIVERMAQAK